MTDTAGTTASNIDTERRFAFHCNDIAFRTAIIEGDSWQESANPWTRDHERFATAWAGLVTVHARRGMSAGDQGRWLRVRYGVETVRELTKAQARSAGRQVNAWRFSADPAMVARYILADLTRRIERLAADTLAGAVVNDSTLEAFAGQVCRAVVFDNFKRAREHVGLVAASPIVVAWGHDEPPWPVRRSDAGAGIINLGQL